MSLQFISITRRLYSGTADTSTLSLSERRPDVLGVLGNLPHGAEIAPKTDGDRRKLIAWLESLTFDGEG
jgi:hypothetical protein